MAEDTWETQEQPILEAVRAGEQSGELLDSADAGYAAGLDETASGWAVQALAEGGFLTGTKSSSGAVPYVGFINLRLTPVGRRQVGQWPADPAQAFLAALDRRIAAETDDEKRSHLQRARTFLGSLATDVLAEIAVAAGRAAMTGML
jgi:hypothetical protein